MEVLSALFSAIWSRFTGAAWFEYVQWPFWTFLVLIAIGGVYQAKFGKNTLVCRGITGALKLALIYMVIVGLYIIFPSYMSRVSQYPFLSMTETTMTLVNPLGLFDRWKTTLPEVMVRLYFLLFFINGAGSFDYSGKGIVSWIGSQLLSCSIAVGFYEAVSYAVLRVWRSILPVNWLFLGVAGLLLIPCLLLLLMKLFFILFRKGGNAFYSDVMQFLTSQKFGSLFSVSLFSMVAVLIFLVVVNSFGISRMAVADFSRPAYLIIMLMCTATLLVFSLFYTERKP